MPFRPTHPRTVDPSAPLDDTHSWAGLAGATGAIVLWSAGNIMVRSIDMPGVQIAFWRITLSATAYWLYLRARRRTITRAQFRASAPAAIAIALEIAVFFVAIQNTTVANATIISALQPIVLLAVLSRFGERVTRVLAVIVFTAVGGVALVILGSADQATWSPRGDFLSVVALGLFSAYFFYAKRARAEVGAFEFQTAVWIIGAAVLLPIAVFDAGGVVLPSGTQWAWLIGLFFVPGTGHLFMNWAHSRLRLSLTSMLTLLLPVLSAAGAAVFLDEPIAAVQTIGMITVIGALVAAIRRNAVLRQRASRADRS